MSPFVTLLQLDIRFFTLFFFCLDVAASYYSLIRMQHRLKSSALNNLQTTCKYAPVRASYDEPNVRACVCVYVCVSVCVCACLCVALT